MSNNNRYLLILIAAACMAFPYTKRPALVYYQLPTTVINCYAEKGYPMLDPRVYSTADQSAKDRLKLLRFDAQLLSVTQTLKALNLWDDPQVAFYYGLAQTGTSQARQRAFVFFQNLIRQYKQIQIETQDPYMPYATAEQISNNCKGYHILDQFHNKIPFYAPDRAMPLAWIVLGKPGGGKSSACFNILRQCGSTPFLLCDPKGTWRYRAGQLNAEYIDAEYVSLDLAEPENISNRIWLFAYVEGIASIMGLQYSVSCLYQACDIAISQRQRYIQKTGNTTALCLKDIYLALGLCSGGNAKQQQYRASAQTALETLIGTNDLFSNRGGLPLDKLLNGRYILGCRYLSAAQSRLLAWHILAYDYFRAYNRPEITSTLGLVVFDDSSKFVSRPDNVFGSSGSISAYLHILSNLRSTGRSVIFIDQIADPIYPDIMQLCSNWLTVGGLQGSNDLRQVQSAMGLTDEQTRMLVKLKTKEAVCFCPSLYERPVHGFIPEVPAPEVPSNG